MTLGHYLWTNENPNEPGYGEQIDIDVDALPVTARPSNVFKSNLRIGNGPGDVDGPGTADDLERGRLYRCWPVPNFYIDPDDNRLYHSTTPPTQAFLDSLTVEPS